jgi:hypothetical protein
MCIITAIGIYDEILLMDYVGITNLPNVCKYLITHAAAAAAAVAVTVSDSLV